MTRGVSQIDLARVTFDQILEMKEQEIKKTAKVMQEIDDKKISSILQEFIVQDEKQVKMIRDLVDKLHLV